MVLLGYGSYHLHWMDRRRHNVVHIVTWVWQARMGQHDGGVTRNQRVWQ